jgi:hypothetical protein
MQPAHQHLRHRALLTLILCLLAGPAGAQFAPGDLYWVAGSCPATGPCKVFKVTGGGNLANAPALATVDRAPGQIAWTANRALAYLSQFDQNRVVSITPAGAVSPFATGISQPTGLLVTSDGRLLVASYGDHAVYDISAGGSFLNATPFATGLGGARNLLQTRNGRILVADQSYHRVVDITAGGDFLSSMGFARGLGNGPFDLVQDAQGRIFASATFDGVFEVTAGGNFAGTTPHASGRDFIGLAVGPNQELLASALDSGELWNITAPGVVGNGQRYGFGLPGGGDTGVDSVPRPECSDGVDNDGDGLIDYPQDTGCDSADDLSERSPLRPCDDGVDNDGDGLVDVWVDPGCSSALDNSEHSPALPCDDGIDNDGDGAIDTADLGCRNPSFVSESPACQDGADNDGDGKVDFDGGASVYGSPIAEPDPQCGQPYTKQEKGSSGCGLGAELAALLPLLRALHRRRRPAARLPR